MKKYYMIPLIAIIGLIFITETIFAESKSCKLTNLPKIAATHYTGKSFAPDFWGRMDLTEVQNDLKIIKAAGFNSVILVIPWIGFQPNTKPIQYNEQYITYLHTLMLETKKLSLKVIVRLGYAHELSTIPDHKHLNRIVSLPTDESLMQAWLAFAANIYTTVAKYDNFLFGFISWEDFFWLELMHLPIDLELSNQIAKNIGFANYISNVKSTNFKSVIADNGKVLIPKVASTGAPLFIKYWDQWLLKLLKTSQTHFPCLTMEVRVDCEPGPPNQTYICHEDTFDLGGIKAPTVIYYSPAWGANNIGDHVSSDEAIARFSYLIDYVQKFTDNPIFVDQFNYIDNTPGFGLNTQIKPTEITEFLTKSIDVIRKQTIGYGLWTLWDVPANILPNSQFKFGKTGWNFKNASLIELPNSSNMWVYLRKDGYIERDSILNANSTGILMSKKEAYRIELLAYSFDKQIPKLGITVADNEQIIASPTFQQEKLWQFEITDLPISTGYESLSIQNMGNELLLKDIVLYNVVQSSGVMDIRKKPSFYYEEILRLNQQLTTKNPYYLDKTTYSDALVTGLYDDFWASKLFTTKLRVPTNFPANIELQLFVPEIWQGYKNEITVFINGNAVNTYPLKLGLNKLYYKIDENKIGADIELKLEAKYTFSAAQFDSNNYDKRNDLAYLLIGIGFYK